MLSVNAEYVILRMETDRVCCNVAVCVERVGDSWTADLPCHKTAERLGTGTGDSADKAAIDAMLSLFNFFHRSQERLEQWLIDYGETVGPQNAAA